MASPSAADLLVTHALLLAGVADEVAVARRFDLDPAEVHELLLDHQAQGWVQRVSHADRPGWALTSAGQREHAHRLAVEMADADVIPAVLAVYEEFVPLDERFLAALMYWQVGPSPREPLDRNEHRDAGWDERVLMQFHVLVRAVSPLCARLEQKLDRFGGYADRLATALHRVDRCDWAWLDQLRDVSLLAVWYELREDLLATLQLERAARV